MRFIKGMGALGVLLVLALFASANGDRMVVSAELSPSQVVPEVMSNATGKVVAVLEGNLLVVGGTYEGLSSDVATRIRGGAHIHQAAAGENGPIAFELNVSGGTEGTFSGAFVLTDDQVAAFKNGEFYVQIHTEQYNPGELRGQLVVR
ncbi:CHRD domain-containing protein [Marinithermus hydrothermalis]|uniref:CHRD domain containing protein n=1 Tax=Marinithermus hydrothermalis (strain DSM 14884 / JCM 11576 / T1) TaxID=869210 RepID=F2NP38_MARHT|nr:CHRD domain-containing protein [Marinithermus hydrothermalis]AEB11626.1 CHRD domain containing protein [Marinithermus hydrothermalis DSM 14884]